MIVPNGKYIIMDKIEEKELEHIIKSLNYYGVKLVEYKEQLKNVIIDYVRIDLTKSADEDIKFNQQLLTKLYDERK
jgi:hypothetical protein